MCKIHNGIPPSHLPHCIWCRLIPQIDFIVNIVRKCRQNPLLYAWVAMEGEFHFNSNPIDPPGSEILMHEKPNQRRTFVFNAKKAWYIAPCFQNYRKFKGIMASTGAERISDTVRFKHHAIAIPQLTPSKRIPEAAIQLDSAIKQHPKKAPMDELVEIEILRQVLRGERKETIPPNSIQVSKSK